MSEQYARLLENSYLYGSNAPYVEEMYERYLEAPESVSVRWRNYFDQLQAGSSSSVQQSVASTDASKMAGVLQLINAYRTNGVLRADTDPLKLNITRPYDTPDLDPSYHGLAAADMDKEVDTSTTYFHAPVMKLSALVTALEKAYCGTLAVEYMYIRDIHIRNWWAKRIEEFSVHRPATSTEKKKYLLERLTAAESFEKYLNTKYVGVKRFSLDGGDSFIVAMDELIRYGAFKGIDEVVMAMAHRGRLNTLVNILGKPPHDLFAEFEGKAPATLPTGDVKYHNGYSNDLVTEHGVVHISLGYNPSHLEVASSVQTGSARARLDLRQNKKTSKNKESDCIQGECILPVTVHGDGAIIGQGIVQEIFTLIGTRGFCVGGSIRIVINNQVQFTTSDLRDVRTSLYCTDIARMIDMPVLHVNCDDPEAVVAAIQMAVDFRQEFKRDVMLDLVCYRKLGHNEQDTPQITQPFMYKAIKEHPGPRRIYAQKLIDEGVIVAEDEASMVQNYREALDANQITGIPVVDEYALSHESKWDKYLNKPWTPPVDTSLSLAQLKKLAKAITTIPPEVCVHPLVQRVIDDRAAMGKGQMPVDWGMAENLAYASLVKAGIPVRLSGEDTGRGTFSHRQCVVHDQNRKNRLEDPYIPLQHVAVDQAMFAVNDSVLSENAVMGFEYGYSTCTPDSLTIWEAQFGDFANGAQIIIDQFIAAGETKWGIHSGLVLLLPHGFEGQGPEHSSARIERFLELSAEENWVLAQPTTAAQIFHLLRLQVLASYRKPLVVFSPKSLLRHKDATVPLDALAQGTFQMVLPDTVQNVVASKVKRIVICSGRVYYDLVAARQAKQQWDVAIIRLEQLYPFPQDALRLILKQYSKASEVVWCQDEPENQGPWTFVRPLLRDILKPTQLLGASYRPACPAPATGYAKKHQEQSRSLIDAAFAKLKQNF